MRIVVTQIHGNEVADMDRSGDKDEGAGYDIFFKVGTKPFYPLYI